MATHTILQVFDALRQHLREHVDRIERFGKYEFQSEGWLKAEWITVLDQMRAHGHIQRVDREVSVKGRQKIDLMVALDHGLYWIELKHWFMGQQKGHLWRPVDFISELENECEKFSAARAGDRAWVAALCTTHPGAGSWSTAVDQFNRDYAPWQLWVLDDPKDYPDSYFLGVLQVRALEVSRGTTQERGSHSVQ